MPRSCTMMRTHAVYCAGCSSWDAEAGRCRDGKVNPAGWVAAVEVANVLGVRALCPFNKHRERLVRSRCRSQAPCAEPTGSESRTA